MIKQILILITLILPSINYAQEAHAGKIISDYGKIYTVNTPDFKTDTTAQYKVVFDIGRSFENPDNPNALIETAARFINMHHEAGVPTENIKVALVIHGGASTALLKNEFYKEKFPDSKVNPNAELISKLANEGVQVILCGQTASHRKMTKTEILPETQISLSAMTALVQLQNKGYKLINF